ncbi:hypothetical protein FRC03_001456 [Tulasnella sp. 419]|nr:hypothetical protein FRC03_001456 [Tulasnella sp. 419]
MFRPNDPGPSNTKSKNKKNLEATAGGLITTLTIVKESLDGISPPGLKAAVGGLLEILKAAKKTYDNTQDLVELDTHLRKLNRILKTVAGKKETEFSLDLSNRIEQLASDINIIVDSSKDLSSQSSHTKFFLSQDNTANIARLNKSIDTAIQTFQLESLMAIESRVGQLALSSSQYSNHHFFVTHTNIALQHQVIKFYKTLKTLKPTPNPSTTR